MTNTDIDTEISNPCSKHGFPQVIFGNILNFKMTYNLACSSGHSVPYIPYSLHRHLTAPASYCLYIFFMEVTLKKKRKHNLVWHFFCIQTKASLSSE